MDTEVTDQYSNTVGQLAGGGGGGGGSGGGGVYTSVCETACVKSIYTNLMVHGRRCFLRSSHTYSQSWMDMSL